jgi:enoyl-CoA hydratase/carnithine racemase
MLMPVQYRMFSDMNYDNILVEKKEGGVALVTLNRPKALNALCHALFNDLADAMSTLDKDPEVSAIVLTGSEKAFAAGADIKEMQPRTFPDTYLSDMLTWWD